jgi:tetratricopeptide (TPR) repeat protein
LDEALAYAYDAIELSRSLDNAFGIRDGMARVSSLRVEKGELGRAITEYEELLARYTDQDDFIVFGLPNIALAYAALGNTAPIRKRYEAEQQRAAHLGPVFRDYYLSPLALIYALEGRPKHAAEILAQFAYDVQTKPFEPIHAWNFLAAAHMFFSRGEFDQVISLVERVKAAQSEDEMNYFLGDFLLLQAQALLKKDSPLPDRARDALRQAKLTQEESGSQRILWRILTALADLSAPEEAAALRREAWQIASRIADGIEDADLRETFLKHPDVVKVMAAVVS